METQPLFIKRHLLAVLSLSVFCIVAPSPLMAQNRALIVNPAEDYYERCKQFYDSAIGTKDVRLKSQYLQQAIPFFKDYLNQYPGHENTQAAKYYLGESYYLLGDLRSAKRYLSSVIHQYQHGRYVAAAAHRLAYDAYSQKNYTEAAPLFEKTALNASREEDKQRGRYLQAQCYLHLKQNKKALSALRPILISKNKKNVYYQRARLQAAHIHRVNKDYAKALSYYKELDADMTEEAIRVEALLNAGLCSAQLEQPAKAEEYYQAVLLSTHSDFKPQAQVSLLSAYYDQGEYDKVLRLVSRERVPLQGELLAQRSLILGLCYMQKKNYFEAVDTFKLVESAAPGSELGFEAGYRRLLCQYNLKRSAVPFFTDEFVANYAVGRGGHKYIHQALLMKAETLYDEEKFTEAVEVYNAIKPEIIAESNRPSLLFKKAWTLSETGNYDNAAVHYSQFIEGYPKDPRILNARTMRGQAYMALGDRLNALKDFDAIIEQDPASDFGAIALQSSAKLKKESQNYVDMIRRYEMLLTKHPQIDKPVSGNAKYWIGWGYFQQKNYSEATAPLKEAIQIDPKAYGKPASLLLVLCHYSLKDVEALKEACMLATDQNITTKIPVSVFRWLGSQCYSAGEYTQADLYLSLGVTPTSPRQTPKIFWRLLSKARVKSKQPEKALEAIEHFLAVETDPPLVADSLLDKAISLYQVEKWVESKEIATQAMNMNPQGRLKAGLRMVLGDIAFQAEDYQTAVKEYVIVSNFDADLTLQPRALQGAMKSLKELGNHTEARRYETLLREKYPEILLQ